MPTTTARKPAKKRSYTPMTAEERDARAKELHEKLNGAVTELLNSPDQWEEFLQVVIQFGGQYSFSNQILIWKQAMMRGFEPTMVMPAGDQKVLREGGTPKYGWAKLGRHPIKGQKGLQIFRPQRYRWREDEYAAQSADWRAKHPRDAQKRPPYKGTSFAVAFVFDVSQTDGAPVDVPGPTTVRRRIKVGSGAQAQLLTGDDTTGQLGAVIELIRKRGYSFGYRSQADFAAEGMGTANGVTFASPRSEVWVHADRSEAQQLKTSIHELAHIDCGHLAPGSDYVTHRGHHETEAESVAFIVAGILGLDTSAYSIPYVSGWAKDEKTLAAAATMVLKTAKAILNELAPVADEAEEVPEEA